MRRMQRVSQWVLNEIHLKNLLILCYCFFIGMLLSYLIFSLPVTVIQIGAIPGALLFMVSWFFWAQRHSNAMMEQMSQMGMFM